MTFMKWYEEQKFRDQRKPTNFTTWLNKVRKNHKRFREDFGFTSKSFKITVDCSGVGQVVQQLIDYVPSYLRDYDLTEKDLLKPTINVNGKEYKTTKHLSGYIERKKELPDWTKKRISRISANLGEEYAKQANKDYQAVVSISPKAFAKIGYYGSDNGSCWGSFNSHMKYAFAQHPNTFVVLIGRNINGRNFLNVNKKIILRAVGIYEPDNGRILISNTKGSVIPEQIYKLMKELIGKFHPEYEKSTNQHRFQYRGGVAYSDPTEMVFYKDAIGELNQVRFETCLTN